VLLVHAGNRPDAPDRTTPRFPVANVTAVRAQLEKVLSSLAPTAVVSAAAAGADLLVLDAAQSLGIVVHVLVPISAAEFVRRSVSDAGERWTAQFEAVLAGATRPGSSVVELDGHAGDGWLRAANAALVALARERAAPGEPVVALTVRPAQAAGERSITDDFAERALVNGWLVLTLDPRRPADGVLVG
jgi:hypothetical protein